MGRQVALDDVQVGSAHAAGMHSNEDLAGSQGAQFALFERQPILFDVADLAEDRGSHSPVLHVASFAGRFRVTSYLPVSVGELYQRFRE